MKNRNIDTFRSKELQDRKMISVKGGAWWVIAIEVALIILDDPEDFGRGLRDGCSTCG